jgi:hypothetical protein
LWGRVALATLWNENQIPNSIKLYSMIALNFRNLLTLLLIGFAIGLCSSFLFTGCKKSTHSKTNIVVSPKELKKQADTIQENYQKQIDDLQDQNIELAQNLEVTQGLLEQTKQLCKQKEQQIKKLTEPKGFPAKDLLAKINKPKTDSDCDTLASLVVEYIENNHQKDSLYEVQVIQMDSLVSVKDKLIETNERAYMNLNLLFDQSLTAQQSLIKENKFLQRQFKRQRFKSKVVTVGLMILTATVTKYLSHH